MTIQSKRQTLKLHKPEEFPITNLQVWTAAKRNLSRYVSERGRHTGPQPWDGQEDSVPGDLQARGHDVLRLEELDEGRIVGECKVKQRPLGHRLQHVTPGLR